MRSTLIGLVLLLGSSISYARMDPPKIEIPEAPAAAQKPLIDSVEDLKEMAKQTKIIADKVMPATVGIFVGGSAGSGVIVSKDGIVLTAGHVSGEPHKKLTVVLADGKRLDAESLGRNSSGFGGGVDSGMIKIKVPGEYPYVKMAQLSDIKKGEWCIAIGHPGGYKPDRPAVVRVGKVFRFDKEKIQTDCTLVGGDSGGPLFDMEGRLIGIHSQIQPDITGNIHISIGTYRDTWAKLLKGVDIGQVWFGVSQSDDSTNDCKLGEITANSPAQKAGLKEKDIITKFDGKTVKDYPEMKKLLAEKDPGDEVEIELKRGDEKLTVKVKLGNQSERNSGTTRSRR